MIFSQFKKDFMELITNKDTIEQKNNVLEDNQNPIITNNKVFLDLVKQATGFDTVNITKTDVYKSYIILLVNDRKTQALKDIKSKLVIVNKYYDILSVLPKDSNLTYTISFTPADDGSLYYIRFLKTDNDIDQYAIIKTNTFLNNLKDEFFEYKETQITIDGYSFNQSGLLNYFNNFNMGIDYGNRDIVNFWYSASASTINDSAEIVNFLYLTRYKNEQEIKEINKDQIFSEIHAFLNVDNIFLKTNSINDNEYNYTIAYSQKNDITFTYDYYDPNYTSQQKSVYSDAARYVTSKETNFNYWSYKIKFNRYISINEDTTIATRLNNGWTNPISNPSSEWPKRVSCTNPVTGRHTRCEAGTYKGTDISGNVWYDRSERGDPIWACSASTGSICILNNPANKTYQAIKMNVEISTKPQVFYIQGVRDSESVQILKSSKKYGKDIKYHKDYFYWINNSNQLMVNNLFDVTICDAKKIYSNKDTLIIVTPDNKIGLVYYSRSNNVKSSVTYRYSKINYDSLTEPLNLNIINENHLNFVSTYDNNACSLFTFNYSNQRVNSKEYVYKTYLNSVDNAIGIRIQLIKNNQLIIYDSLLKDFLISSDTAVYNTLIDNWQMLDDDSYKIRLVSQTNNYIWESPYVLDKDILKKISLNINLKLQAIKNENEIETPIENAALSLIKYFKTGDRGQGLGNSFDLYNSKGDVKSEKIDKYLYYENDELFFKATFINDVKEIRFQIGGSFFFYQINLNDGDYMNFTMKIELKE